MKLQKTTHNTKCNFIRILTTLIFIGLLGLVSMSMAVLPIIAQEGQIIRENVYSPSLEGNFLGDSPNRQVTIYLPPSYNVEPNRFYPVSYTLHGYDAQNDWLMGTNYSIGGGNILDAMNSWIAEGKVKEMILVMPNANNKYGGSHYLNSIVTGNWADFIARDLVDYIDSHYRTLPQRESRAIFGHSMGSLAVSLGMLYPEVFGAIGGIGGGYDFDFALSDNATQAGAAFVASLDESTTFGSLAYPFKVLVAQLAAFAPNPDNLPFYFDSPFVYADGKSGPVVKRQDIYDKIIELSPLHVTDRHIGDLLNMRAIYIDCGINDANIEHNRRFHEKLDELGINHIYYEFQGDHNSHVLQNTGKALGIFSGALEFELLSLETAVTPKRKLATVWSNIKQIQ